MLVEKYPFATSRGVEAPLEPSSDAHAQETTARTRNVNRSCLSAADERIGPSEEYEETAQVRKASQTNVKQTSRRHCTFSQLISESEHRVENMFSTQTHKNTEK